MKTTLMIGNHRMARVTKGMEGIDEARDVAAAMRRDILQEGMDDPHSHELSYGGWNRFKWTV